MAKSSGYVRDYRSRRAAVGGIPLTVAGRRAAERRFLDSKDTSGGLAGIAPPSGRAPRGKGQEYEDRRWIVDKISTQRKFAAQNAAQLDRSRGQRNRSYDDSYRRARVTSLRAAIGTAIEVANSDADWGFKREIIGDIFREVSASFGRV